MEKLEETPFLNEFPLKMCFCFTPEKCVLKHIYMYIPRTFQSRAAQVDAWPTATSVTEEIKQIVLGSGIFFPQQQPCRSGSCL